MMVWMMDVAKLMGCGAFATALGRLIPYTHEISFSQSIVLKRPPDPSSISQSSQLHNEFSDATARRTDLLVLLVPCVCIALSTYTYGHRFAAAYIVSSSLIPSSPLLSSSLHLLAKRPFTPFWTSSFWRQFSL
jgi:hypothetical protein